MNFSLIPMPAAQELALNYVPSASSNRLAVALYLLALLFMFQLSPEGRSADVPTDAAETALLAEASCDDCIQTTLSPRPTKD